MAQGTQKILLEKEQLCLFESHEIRAIASQKNCHPPDYEGPIKFQKIGPNNWSKILSGNKINFVRKFCLCKKFNDGVFCEAFKYCRTLKKGGGE